MQAASTGGKYRRSTGGKAHKDTNKSKIYPVSLWSNEQVYRCARTGVYEGAYTQPFLFLL